MNSYEQNQEQNQDFLDAFRQKMARLQEEVSSLPHVAECDQGSNKTRQPDDLQLKDDAHSYDIYGMALDFFIVGKNLRTNRPDDFSISQRVFGRPFEDIPTIEIEMDGERIIIRRLISGDNWRQIYASHRHSVKGWVPGPILNFDKHEWSRTLDILGGKVNLSNGSDMPLPLDASWEDTELNTVETKEGDFMSTKSTIDHGEDFHLYTELSDDNHVFLELTEADFMATPGSITVSIPLSTWDRIREHKANPINLADS